MSIGQGNSASTSNMPLARDDTGATTQSADITIDVLENDRGGAAKSLYSVNQSNLVVASTLGASAKGATLTISNSTITYSPGSLFDSLALGQTTTDTFSYAIRLGNGAISTATVTVTITGTNDAPVAVADTATGKENEILTVAVLANDKDVDDGAVLSLASAFVPAGKGTASLAGNGLVFDPGSDFDHLAAGVKASVVIDYSIEDEHAAISMSTLTIEITGTNDLASISGENSGSVTEDGTLIAQGTLTVSDVDDGEAELAAIASGTVGANGYGTFEVGPDGQWTYTLLNDHSAVQSLAGGAQATDSIVVYSRDGTTSETITVTINGAAESSPGFLPSVTGVGYNITAVEGSYYYYHGYAYSNAFYYDYDLVYNNTYVESFYQNSPEYAPGVVNSQALARHETVDYGFYYASYESYSYVQDRSTIMEFYLPGLESSNDLSLRIASYSVNADDGAITVKVFAYSGDGIVDASDWGAGVLVGTATLTTGDSGTSFVFDLDEALVNPILASGDYLGLRLVAESLDPYPLGIYYYAYQSEELQFDAAATTLMIAVA